MPLLIIRILTDRFRLSSDIADIDFHILIVVENGGRFVSINPVWHGRRYFNPIVFFGSDFVS